jgi:hypothetical protein
VAWRSRLVIREAVALKHPKAAASRRPGRPPAFLPADLEPILPAQWCAAERGSLQPAKRLMLAVLTDAIELVLQKRSPAATRRAVLQRRAVVWMRSDDRGGFFSFLNICETLGFDGKRLRGRVALLAERPDTTPREP